MRKIIKLSGVTVDNETLPRVVVSSEERAIASMPQLLFWMQAGPSFASGNSFLDRATGEMIVPRSTSNYWGQTSFPNGAPAIQAVPDDEAAIYLPGGNPRLNPDRWSVAAAVDVEYDGSGRRELLSAAETLSGELAIRLQWTVNGRLQLLGAAPGEVRLISSGVDMGSGPIVMMCTFSVERGIRFFMNGIEVAANPDDRQPLENTSFQIGGGPGITSASSAVFRGKLGHLLVFNTDLSAPENNGARLALNKILMDRYGIS